MGSPLLFSRAGGLSDQGHGFSGIIARFESNHCGLFSADNLTNDEFEIDARFAQCFRYRISETGALLSPSTNKAGIVEALKPAACAAWTVFLPVIG